MCPGCSGCIICWAPWSALMRVGELTRMRSGECGDTGPLLLPAPVGVDAADVDVCIGGVGVLAHIFA